jgi:hypothetical protein
MRIPLPATHRDRPRQDRPPQDRPRHDRPTTSELTAAAIRYLRAGWPVAPARLPIRAPGASVSVRELAVHVPPTDEATAGRWWSVRRAGIAALTGIAFDVLIVPAGIGHQVSAAFPPGAVPAAAPPSGDWLLPVTTGTPLADELADRGVRLHGAGDYVLLPPTPLGTGVLTWVTGPLTGGAQQPVHLPHALAVQRAALEALRGPRRAHPARRAGRTRPGHRRGDR